MWPSSSNVSIGKGIYKSTDAGRTWQFSGLKDGGQIGAIVIHPTNPNVVFAAVVGNPFANTKTRGVYRTRNGGTSWEQVVALLARAAADGPAAPPAVSRPASRLNGRERAALIDQELRGHGIEPGHASLYPDDPVTGGPPV